jgi:hypothetical protein
MRVLIAFMSMLVVGVVAFGASGMAMTGDRQASAAPVVESRGRAVLGTIQATVDGARMEFYIVAGETGGEPYASAAWHEPREGRVVAAIGGLDTPTPPLETFMRGAAGTMSFGSYHGPVLSLALDLSGDPRPFTVELPSDDNASTVIFMPEATVDDLDLMFLLEVGVVSVSEVSLVSGHLRAVGTFSGTVRSMGSGETVEIADGRFSFEGAPNMSEITP